MLSNELLGLSFTALSIYAVPSITDFKDKNYFNLNLLILKSNDPFYCFIKQ